MFPTRKTARSAEWANDKLTDSRRDDVAGIGKELAGERNGACGIVADKRK